MKQFVKFGIVGVSNTALSYVIFISVSFCFEELGITFDKDYLVASIIAFIISVLWSFYWNNRFTFHQEDGETRSIGKALLKTYISYSLTGLLLNNILLWILVDRISINKTIAYMMVIIFTVPLNYLMNKYWAFKKDEGE